MPAVGEVGFGLLVAETHDLPGCRGQGTGYRVQGAGFRVQGSGCGVQGSGSRVPSKLA